MGKPLTIQEDDDKRLLALKNDLNVESKIAVLRLGLDLLEKEVERRRRERRWLRAVGQVKKTSRQVNREFQKMSQLKKVD